MSNAGKKTGKQRQSRTKQRNLKAELKSLDAKIARHPRDSLLYRERGHLQLYLGKTQQARSDFDATERLDATDFHTRPGRLHCDMEYNAIGITYWMEEHRELALAFWRFTTGSLAANRVSYAQWGGGIRAGLLLWFGAVHEHTKDDVELVRSFYEKRLTSTFWSHDLSGWPGPLVRFFLKQIDESSLLESAEDDPHQLCDAHFALAIRARESGRHAAYRKHLQLVAPRQSADEVYDYYNMYHYFLAKYELDKAGI